MAIGDTVQAGLLRADFSPIERGGVAKGRAYSAIGQGIGGAIEKYQLNKEKREAEERTAMGSLASFSAEELMEFKSRDPKLSKAIDNIQSDKASPKDFQLINASSAPYIAGRSRRLQEENAQIKNSLSKLNFEMAKILQLPKVRDAIDQYGLNQVERDFKRQTIPSQTSATISSNKATEMKGDIFVADVMSRGGPGGVAKDLEIDRDLTRANTQSQIDYRNNAGLAQLYKSLAEKNPTFAEQFTPLASLQDKLRGVTVKTPKGESVTYAEYEKLHNKEPDLYPMNNEPGAIRGQIESVNSQIYNLSREQTVQVNVPDEVNVQSEQAPSTIPPYKQALQKIGEDTQKEYMDTPGVGGYGFPFMP